MNILITNDDGIQAAGINYLRSLLCHKGHNVWTVAPQSERSGYSSHITIHDAIREKQINQNSFAISGTPTDCVTYGLLGLVPCQIDLVVAGINHGPNIGKDIIYSGTFAAARQAVVQHRPGFAVSLDYWGTSEAHFEIFDDFFNKYFDRLVELSIQTNAVININAPNIQPDKLRGVKVTTLSTKMYYKDTLVSFDSPNQGRYHWIKGECVNRDYEPNSDRQAIADNFISVTAVNVMPDSIDIQL